MILDDELVTGSSSFKFNEWIIKFVDGGSFELFVIAVWLLAAAASHYNKVRIKYRNLYKFLNFDGTTQSID